MLPQRAAPCSRGSLGKESKDPTTVKPVPGMVRHRAELHRSTFPNWVQGARLNDLSNGPENGYRGETPCPMDRPEKRVTNPARPCVSTNGLAHIVFCVPVPWFGSVQPHICQPRSSLIRKYGPLECRSSTDRGPTGRQWCTFCNRSLRGSCRSFKRGSSTWLNLVDVHEM
jgi:hypothetical protein